MRVLQIFIVEIPIGFQFATLWVGLVDHIARLEEEKVVLVLDGEVDISGPFLGESRWKAMSRQGDRCESHRKILSSPGCQVGFVETDTYRRLQ